MQLEQEEVEGEEEVGLQHCKSEHYAKLVYKSVD
jgi:hypothetical protein